MIVMLGGPIKAGFQGTKFDSALRQRVRSLAEALVASGIELRSAHLAENFQVLSDLDRRTVAARDLLWAKEADAYVAVLPCDATGTMVPSFGTGVEVGWMMSMGKPIWLLVDIDLIHRYSPFLSSLPAAGEVHLVPLAKDGAYEDLVSHVRRRLAASC
jgi:nucleoside 2-deoxyribosyltransferase